jgi:outer membrane beta-barrel protein
VLSLALGNKSKLGLASRTIRNINLGLALCLMVGFVNSAEAKKIRLSEDELSQEAVMPVFDEKLVIKNRRVTHAKKIELGLYGGNVMSEAIYDPLTFGGSLAYHFDNTHGFFLAVGMYQDKLSSNGKRLKSGDVIPVGPIGGPKKYFDASRAPHKEFMVAGHYQYTAYYGKVSLTKESVMNLSLYGLLGAGAYLMDGDVAPLINMGVGQRFYFTKNIAFRLDLLLSSFYGPDITSTAGTANSLDNSAPAAKVDASAFDKKMFFDTQINFGITLLL